MIANSETRKGYIGGSDQYAVYGNYYTATFHKWWNEKITGIRLYDIKTRDMTFGSVVEGLIMDHMDIPKENRHMKVFHPKFKMAGANTDAYWNGILMEIKTMNDKDAEKLVKGNKMKVGYRRQVYHTMWCGGITHAKISVLSIKPEEKENPFGIKIIEGENLRHYDFELDPNDFDIPEHEIRIGYLSSCYESRHLPSNEGLEMYRLHRV